MTFHILTKSSRTLSQQKKNESLKPFFHRNPEFDLKTFNFFDKNAVTALNWEGLEQEQISDRLQGYQRLLNLHPKSASHLARIPRKIFVAKHASLHQRATGVRNRDKAPVGTVASPLFPNSPTDAHPKGSALARIAL